MQRNNLENQNGIKVATREIGSGPLATLGQNDPRLAWAAAWVNMPGVRGRGVGRGGRPMVPTVWRERLARWQRVRTQVPNRDVNPSLKPTGCLESTSFFSWIFIL